MIGWECPKCGRVNAPWVAQCSCYEPLLPGTTFIPTNPWPYLPPATPWPGTAIPYSPPIWPTTVYF